MSRRSTDSPRRSTTSVDRGHIKDAAAAAFTASASSFVRPNDLKTPRRQVSHVLDNRQRTYLDDDKPPIHKNKLKYGGTFNKHGDCSMSSPSSSPASPSIEHFMQATSIRSDERSPLHRSASMPPTKYYVRVYFSPAVSEEVHASTPVVCIESGKITESQTLVETAISMLKNGKSKSLIIGDSSDYELCETMCSSGYLCKERRLCPTDNPVTVQLLWPQATRNDYKFCLRRRRKLPEASLEDDHTPIHIAPGQRQGGLHGISTIDEQTSFLTSILAAPRNNKKCPPDLCNLPDLSERTLLDNLRRRFEAGEIYTYVGSILIAVNPFRFLPMYNPTDVRRYTRLRKLSERPPHVFAIAGAAYQAMLSRRQDQCIVISGESGSGKTESTNFLLHHLSALSSNSLDESRTNDRDVVGIEQLMLGAGPVLEGFGNAKTCHNNNSSRFGKFIQVQYSQNGMVQGAIVEKYLLEKSRIITQTLNERNYHVFYYLLAGSESKLRQDLHLTEAKDYEYLNKSGCFELQNMDGDTVDERIEFQRLCQSMETVGFSHDIQQRIFSVLSAVLHIGNIQLKKAGHHHHEVVAIHNKEEIKIISDLLKVKESTLIEALTKRRAMAGEEAVIMNHTMGDALATRDAMAKCLYSALFDWIVLQLNRALLSKRESHEHQGNSIGVLDIFGFEDFAHNSFEQFCINFANEHLQYYFNQHIFKFEQEEYVREGIIWKNIEFIDNTDCLTLFTKKRTGLLSLLDEECNFPAGTESTLLANFNFHHQSSPYYDVPQIKYDAFLIKHYAGNVKYYVKDFREKNNDLMRHDIMLVLKNSTMSFVREIVGYDPVAILRWAILRAFFRATFAFRAAGKVHADKIARKSSDTIVERVRSHLSLRENTTDGSSPHSRQIKRRSMYVSRYRTSKDLGPLRVYPSLENLTDVQRQRRISRIMMKNKTFKPRLKPVKQLRDLKAMKTVMGHLPPPPRNNKNKPPSVSAQFNYSLQRMLKTLNEANPLFIRCIKSNADKLPMTFDSDIVVRQLHYTGMLATVHIRRSGYNYRLLFSDFAAHYKHLAPRDKLPFFDQRSVISSFLQSLNLNTDNYQIGKSKVFLREAEKIHLDELLHANITQRVICIQRQIKTKLTRMSYVRTRNAIIKIQTHVRSLIARKKVNRLRLCMYAAIAIQRMFRGFKVRKLLTVQHSAATTIQSAYRAYVAREVCKELMKQRHREIRREERKKVWEHEETEARKRKSMESLNRDSVVSSCHQAISTVPQGLRHPLSRDRTYDTKDIPSSNPLRSPPLHRPSTPPIHHRPKGILEAPSTTFHRAALKHDHHRDVTPPPVDPSPQPIGRTVRIIETPPRVIETMPTAPQGPSIIYKPIINPVSDVDASHPASNPDRATESPEHQKSVFQNMHRHGQRRRVSPMMTPVTRQYIDTSKQKHKDIIRCPSSKSDFFYEANQRPTSINSDESSDLLRKKPISKTKSLELLENLQTLQEKQPVKKRVSAPLAQQESITDSEFDSNDTSGVVYTISLQPDSPILYFGHSRDEHHITKKSQVVNSVVKRIFMADESLSKLQLSTTSGVEDFLDSKPIRINKRISLSCIKEPSSPPKIHVTAAIARGNMLDNQLPECSGHISPGVVRRTCNDFRSMTLPRKVNSSYYSVSSLPRESQTLNPKKKTSLSFSRYSKLSLKDLLQSKQISSTKKTKSAKSFDEDSDYDNDNINHSISGQIHHDDSAELSLIDTFRKQRIPRSRKPSKKRKYHESRETASLNINHVSQWKIPQMILVTGLGELDQLYNFFYSKRKEINTMENSFRKSDKEYSLFENVFSKSLAEFINYVYTMKTINREQEKKLIFTYLQLLTKFQDILICKTKQHSSDTGLFNKNNSCSQEELPTTMGINAFRGFLDEYLKKKENGTLMEIHKVKNKKKKKHVKDSVIIYYGHQYILQQFSIRTFCEYCNSYIWLEKGQVCKSCKYTVHKKCYQKSEKTCKGFTCSKNDDEANGVIGVQFNHLLNGNSVPPVIESLFQSIEKNGLYTEGIYRKSGSQVKIKKLVILVNDDYTKINFDDYHVFELAAIVKKFFREMPQPLLTFELYDDFIRTSEVTDDQERLEYMFSLFQRLPAPNYDLLERLMSHLAIIAEFQEYNRMSATSLAVIFAPCLLRTNIALPLQDVMNPRYIAKLNLTIQTIVEVQMERRLELKDVHNDLSKQEHQFEQELINVRASFKEDNIERPLIDKERNLLGQIDSIRQEKEDITLTVAALEMRVSSSEDDLLSTADELDGYDRNSEISMCTAASTDGSDSKLNYYDAPTTPTDKKDWPGALPEALRRNNTSILSPPLSQLQKFSLPEVTNTSPILRHPVKERVLTPSYKKLQKSSDLEPTPEDLLSKDSSTDDQKGDRRPANRKPTFIQVGEEILV